MSIKSYTITADGGSRGNPGPAASAFVVWRGDKPVFQFAHYIGETTNNQAEYQAVLLSLEWLYVQPQLPDYITWQLDSQLVAKQLAGLWQIKDYHIKQLKTQCVNLLDALLPLGSYEFIHIPREDNTHADALVNKCLDINT